MKKIVATIILLNFFLLGVYAQDTLKKNRFIINTYPSNLLVGDISLGIEHVYRKRLSHEFMFFYKVFSPNATFYKYDKGFRLNYLIKYNFIHRKYFRMSGNISLVYKDLYYNNKEDYWYEKFTTDHGLIKEITFLMDRKIKAYGIGFGLTLNFRITSKISIGSDIMIEYLKTQKSYSVKESIKGDITNYSSYYGVSVPTNYVSRYYTRYSLFPTLKVSYQLGH
jgi:hypothetical protein